MGKRYNYTYRVRFPTQKWFYFGLHSTDDLNDGYSGSPCTHRDKWENYFWEFEILEFFETREDAAKLEHRLIKPFLNDPLCLNEHCGGSYSLQSLSDAGKKGGRTAVDSGQLELARKNCHNERQRVGSSRAMKEYNNSRTREDFIEKARLGGNAWAEKYSRPVRAVHTVTGETHDFSSIKECCETLSLVRSNVTNILNKKRNNPHKGWNLLDILDPE